MSVKEHPLLPWMAVSDACRAALEAIHGDPQPAVILVTGRPAGTVLRLAALTWAFVNGDRVLWNARTPVGATVAADRLEYMITGSEPLSAHLRRVSRVHGRQEIEADNGGRIVIRSGRVHGLSADRVIVSESDGIGWRDAVLMTEMIVRRRADSTVVYGADDVSGEMLADLAARAAKGEPVSGIRYAHCRT